jgi:hypothetical protein
MWLWSKPTVPLPHSFDTRAASNGGEAALAAVAEIADLCTIGSCSSKIC